MNKIEVINAVLGGVPKLEPQKAEALAFAPSNIALVKYWGKRDVELNLPVTSSLSVSLAAKGAHTTLKLNEDGRNKISVAGVEVDHESPLAQRASQFFNLFRQGRAIYFTLDTQSDLPIAAGLASSASGFAALVLSMDQLFGWQLTRRKLSILARLGSGSACRSLWPGFVEWQRGTRANGMDSHGIPLTASWPELCIGLVMVDEHEKPLSSRVAMQRTVESSQLYQAWPKQVRQDLTLLKQAIQIKDFALLGQVAENSALSMHATMLAAWPAIMYSQAATITAMHKVWQLRREGLTVFFTQDAGPNIKLLFLKQDEEVVRKHFSRLEVVQPFLSI